MARHHCELPVEGHVGDRWRCGCGRRWWCSSDPASVGCPVSPEADEWMSALWQRCRPWWPHRHAPYVWS